MRFSIIIPLEFHRGLAEKCIRGWSQEQSLHRENYEILIAAPQAHDAAELSLLTALLGTHDRIFKYPLTHDMPLVAAAAREARGEILVFTEAHCLPEPNFLAQAATVFDEQPQWAGFSGRSIPITHNLLSEIEAEMYDEDISRNMQKHTWLKVLDQCFIIRRDAYELVGGVEPQYGHFAEWLLAARLHRRGLKIGYDPRPAVRHYYIGDLRELEEFTLDFAAGQMRFARQAATDPCGDLFDEVPEWNQRHAHNPRVAGKFLRLFARDLATQFFQRDGQSVSAKLRDAPWVLAGQWLARRALPAFATRRQHERELRRWRQATERGLASADKAAAKTAFLQLMDRCVHIGRLQYLDTLPPAHLAESFASPSRDHSEWRAGLREVFPTSGFHNFELHQRVGFRWSQPAAMVRLPPMPGDWRMVIEWGVPQPLAHLAAARFYFDEQAISAEHMAHYCDRSEFTVRGTDESATLAWFCPAIDAPGDSRQLGLPVACIRWTKAEHLPAVETVAAGGAPRETTYFLHVPKCAGTTTRLLLTNAHVAEDILSPFDVGFYYAAQLPQHPEIAHTYSFAAGHFGWELPTLAADRNWRVVTVLREPLDRLLSKFDYLRQHHRLPGDLQLVDWLERELIMKDLIMPYFLPGVLQSELRGAEQLGGQLHAGLPQAIANLQTCAVVGLQEQMDDSIDLLCWTLGQLPPAQVPRANVTLARTRRPEIGPRALQIYDEFLATEIEFHREATALFRKQLATMQAQLAAEAGQPLDAAATRSHLRRKYFERRSQAWANRALLQQFAWEPQDQFLGFNLYDRERHGDYQLRWTGPAPTTDFYLPLDPARRIEIALRLHPATPAPHAQTARLTVNGQVVPLQCNATARGYELTGAFLPGAPCVECGLFSELKLTTPTLREANAFREIGVALTGIELRAATSVVPKPHLTLQAARVS